MRARETAPFLFAECCSVCGNRIEFQLNEGIRLRTEGRNQCRFRSTSRHNRAATKRVSDGARSRWNTTVLWLYGSAVVEPPFPVARSSYLGEACAVVAWFSQLSGSEEVLFDPEKLSSRKNTLGWERTREYSVQECSEREWKAQSRRDHPGLQGKVGWRTVHFCDYISQDQAAMKSWLPFNAICRKSFKRWERCRAAASPISQHSD